MNKEERVLSALSDLTNGASNYYQALQTVMVRESLIREYIEDLQQRIDKVDKYIDRLLNTDDPMYLDAVLITIREILGSKE